MKSWCYGIVMILALMATPSVYAAEKLVLATGEWEPYTSEKMEGYGVFTEIVTAIVKEMGMEPVYEWYPWARGYIYAKNGDVWANFPLSYTDERAQEVDFSEAVMPDPTTAFFYYNSKPIDAITSPNDLKSLRIGGIIGYWYEAIFREAGLQYELVARDEQNFKKLMAERIDLMAMVELAGWYFIKTYYPEEINNFGTMYFPWPKEENANPGLRLGVSRTYPNSQALLEKFNAALAVIKAKGIDQAILKKYGITISQ